MKNLIILIVATAVLASACTTDKVKSFIPGTYIDSATSEYSMVNDTLTIRQSESESNKYFINRKTAFQRISEGKAGKLEYETEQWIAIYDKASQILNETAKGKVITFYPETNRLMVGKREYRKIK
jgi:hypothetical protein